MAAIKKCPCTSGLLYRECCAPYHRGAEPEDCETLLRSRFSAFALHDDEYLFRTLHPDNADRGRPREAYRRAVRGSSVRYMGLTVFDQRPPDETGLAQVLFLASVFERGRDLSFVERSDFRHDGQGYRYVKGLTAPRSALGPDLGGLRLDTFEGLLRRAPRSS